MKAISEGTEVSAQDTITTEHQITSHQIKVWIYNSQNATPLIQRLNALARAAHIPIATVTETLDPASDSFEQWQVAQLRADRAGAAPSHRAMTTAASARPLGSRPSRRLRRSRWTASACGSAVAPC